MLGLLWAMCVDDGRLIDPASAKGKGQQLIQAFFAELGSQLSAPKHQPMATNADLLSVAHDLGDLPDTGEIIFWPAEHILKEIRAMMAAFRGKGTCTPGEASRCRCIYGFAAAAESSQLGKAPMRPLKQRQ